MPDVWINPNQDEVSAVAISAEEMCVGYRLGPAGRQGFANAVAGDLSLREAQIGQRSFLSLRDFTSVSLAPSSNSLLIQYVETGVKRQHRLTLWSREVYGEVVAALQNRLGSSWELRKGMRSWAQAWRHSWAVLVLVLMFTVVGFFALWQHEEGGAPPPRTAKARTARDLVVILAKTIGSSTNWLLIGVGLMVLYTAWLVCRSLVRQDRLVPVLPARIDGKP